MKLSLKDKCPIHNSYFCCGRGQYWAQRSLGVPVRRVEDHHHPRGYRELRSPTAMRVLLKQKVAEQSGCCAICGKVFQDFVEIVPDHRRPRGMGAAWRDDHPDNIAAVHNICNLEKGSKHAELLQTTSGSKAH
jgi:hypothetical protein